MIFKKKIQTGFAHTHRLSVVWHPNWAFSSDIGWRTKFYILAVKFCVYNSVYSWVSFEQDINIVKKIISVVFGIVVFIKMFSKWFWLELRWATIFNGLIALIISSFITITLTPVLIYHLYTDEINRGWGFLAVTIGTRTFTSFFLHVYL